MNNLNFHKTDQKSKIFTGSNSNLQNSQVSKIPFRHVTVSIYLSTFIIRTVCVLYTTCFTQHNYFETKKQNKKVYIKIQRNLKEAQLGKFMGILFFFCRN